MALISGEIYTPTSFKEIRNAFLADVRLEAIAQGVPFDDVPVEEGTEWWILGSAVGHSMMMLYSNQQVHSDNRDVEKASEGQLDEIREQEGLDELPSTVATGRIRVQINGTQTIPDGQAFTLKSGARGQISPQVLGAVDGQEVNAIMLDPGERGNASPGEQVTIISAPGNLRSTATVSNNSPLSGGREDESDAGKRRRIINRRRNRAGAGNWADLIEIALSSSANIQYAFVYPGLGGPSTRKVVLIRDIDPDNNEFARSPSEAAADIVRDALHLYLPKETETIVQSAVEEATNIAVTLSLPDSPGNGGDGTGWLDDVVWPDLAGGDTKVAITVVGTVTDTWDIQVNATTAVSPVAGVTNIAWWSSVDQKFYLRRVETVAGGTGAWQLKLDNALSDSNGDVPLVGEYISPAAKNTEVYGTTFRDTMRRLGPGENTSTAALLPRAKRHPFVERSVWVADLNLKQLAALTNGHAEISDGAWSYRLKSAPTVPGTVSTPPNVLVLNHFGIYEQ